MSTPHGTCRHGCISYLYGEDCHCGADTELANAVPLDPDRKFPAPKGKRMYRLSSHMNTGRTPRTMRDAFNPYCSDELLPMPSPSRPGVRDLFAAIGQVIARVFGR